MRYQWISRLLGNPLIEVDAIMEPLARGPGAAGRGWSQIVLMIDQTHATERHQVLMLAARVSGRALPLAWRVEATEGAIGFARAARGAGSGWRSGCPRERGRS